MVIHLVFRSFDPLYRESATEVCVDFKTILDQIMQYLQLQGGACILHKKDL